MFLCSSKCGIKTAPHKLTVAAMSRQPLSFIFAIDDVQLLLFDPVTSLDAFCRFSTSRLFSMAVESSY